jgi:Protein of unknown function (DUF1153)
MERVVIGPLGTPLTLADLPLPSTVRWVARRKAEIVAAVHGGLLSAQSACAMYNLSLDEFLSWQSTVDQQGLAGLHIRSLGERRRAPRRVRHRRADAHDRGSDDFRSRSGSAASDDTGMHREKRAVGAPGRRPHLTAHVQRQLGLSLRIFYDAILCGPLPERFLALATELERTRHQVHRDERILVA